MLLFSTLFFFFLLPVWVYLFIYDFFNFRWNFALPPNFLKDPRIFLIKKMNFKLLANQYALQGFPSYNGFIYQKSSRLNTRLEATRSSRSKRGGSGPSLPSLDLDLLDAKRFAESPLTANNFIVLRQRLDIVKSEHNPFSLITGPQSVLDWLSGNLSFQYLFMRETPPMDYFNSDSAELNSQLVEIRCFWQEVMCRVTNISSESLLPTKVSNIKVSNGLKCPNDRFLVFNTEIQREVAKSKGVYTSSEIFVKPTVVTLDKLMSEGVLSILRADSTLLTVLASKNEDGTLKFPFLFQLIHGHPETPLNAGKGVKWLASTLEASEIRLLTIIPTEIKSKDGMDNLLEQQLQKQNKKASEPSSTYFEAKIRPRPDSGKVLSFGQGMARSLDLYPTFNQSRGYYDLYAELILSKDTAGKFFKKCCLDPNRKDSFIALQYQTALNYIDLIEQFKKLSSNVNMLPNLGDAKYAYNAPTLAPLEKDTAVVYSQVQAFLSSLQSENKNLRAAALDFLEVLIHTVWFPAIRKPENKHRLANFATQTQSLEQSDDIAFIEEQKNRLASYEAQLQETRALVQEQLAFLQSVEGLSPIWLNQVRDNAPKLFTEMVAWYKSNFRNWQGVEGSESWKQGRQQRFNQLTSLLKELNFMRQLPASGSVNIDGKSIVLSSVKLEKFQQWEKTLKEKLLPDFDTLISKLLSSQKYKNQPIDAWVVANPGMAQEREVINLFTALSELDSDFIFYLRGLEGSLAEVGEAIVKEASTLGLDSSSLFSEVPSEQPRLMESKKEISSESPNKPYPGESEPSSYGSDSPEIITGELPEATPVTETSSSSVDQSDDFSTYDLSAQSEEDVLSNDTVSEGYTLFFDTKQLKFPDLVDKNKKKYQTDAGTPMKKFDKASTRVVNTFARAIRSGYCQAVLDSYFNGKAEPLIQANLDKQASTNDNYAVTPNSVFNEVEFRVNNQVLNIKKDFGILVPNKRILFETLRIAYSEFLSNLKDYEPGTVEYYVAAKNNPIKFYSQEDLKNLKVEEPSSN